MAQGRSKTPKTPSGPKGDVQLSAHPILFPGEDTATYERLRDALLQDLAPQTAYERVLVDDIVNLEWEKVRHRGLRDQLILNAARQEALKAFEPNSSMLELLGEPSPEAKSRVDAFVGADASTAGGDRRVARERARPGSDHGARLQGRRGAG